MCAEKHESVQAGLDVCRFRPMLPKIYMYRH